MNHKKKHIDDVQTATVDEHFDILKSDEALIGSVFTEVEPNDLPEWYDDELFRAGQDYYKKNILSMGLMAMIGLLAVLTVPSILRVLIFTKQSGTPCTAFKRYVQTILHIHTLYMTDVKDKTSDWWKSLNTIRFKHATSNKYTKQQKDYGITHRDMALTQFGFIGYGLLSHEKLSLTNLPKEREGLNHFWRVVGHLLGISDRLNICRKTEAETTQLCDRLLSDVFGKYMQTNFDNFSHMTEILIDGLFSVDFSLNYDAFMYLWYDLSNQKYEKTLGTYSWLNIQYRSCVLYLLRIPYVGFLVRNGFNYYLRINYWLAQRCPLAAWIRFGKSNAQIHLYPKFKSS